MLDHILQRIFFAIPCFVYDLPCLGCIESNLAGLANYDTISANVGSCGLTIV